MPWPVHPTGFLSSRGDEDSYKIERSLRFNSADSAYLSRNFSSGNRKTWTFSGWLKFTGPKSNLYEVLLNTDSSNSGAGNNFSNIILDHYSASSAYNNIGIYCSLTGANVFSKAKIRDYSAWYHVMCVCDTTEVTSTNRIKFYINGTLQTDLHNQSGGAATYPSQDSQLYINNNYEHAIGAFQSNAFSSYKGNFYLAELNFIDGQALTPSSFGETDSITGRWKAKAYSGTYGTNGFYLKFADNSGTTSTTLGKDSSGNGNNWTPNNFSVTAGADNDSLVDSPTNYGSDTGVGGEVRGNYCTLNPIGSQGSGVSISNGNLDITVNGNSASLSTIAIDANSTNGFYAECKINSVTDNGPIIGIRRDDTFGLVQQYIGFGPNDYSIFVWSGIKFNNGSSSSYGSAMSSGDVLGIAVKNGKIYFRNASGWFNSGNPVAETGSAFSGISGYYFIGFSNSSIASTVGGSWNFGQRPFAYAAPTGFLALCTTNLNKDTAITTSGSFTGNASTDGPFVWLNGTPAAMTINGNSVTFGTDADKLAGGFKVRSSSASYNASGSNTFSVSTTERKFKYARAQAN